MVARGRIVLFVGLLVLLVHDDDADVSQRCENGRSGSDDHVEEAVAQAAPGVESLARAHPRVENSDPIAEMASEAPDGLRRERNLGHQDDARAALRSEEHTSELQSR